MIAAVKQKSPRVRGDRQLANSAREAILAAALRSFAKSGFDGTTLLEVARVAGLSHPLVHYHFGNKEELWKAAVDFAFSDLSRAFETVGLASDGLSAVDTLKLLCRAFARFTARYPQHVALIVNESKVEGPRFQWLVERYLRPMHKQLDEVIERATASGQIQAIPAAHLTSFVIGSITQFIFARSLVRDIYGLDSRDIETVSIHAEWMLKVLLDGISVKQPDA